MRGSREGMCWLADFAGVVGKHTTGSSSSRTHCFARCRCRESLPGPGGSLQESCSLSRVTLSGLSHTNARVPSSGCVRHLASMLWPTESAVSSRPWTAGNCTVCRRRMSPKADLALQPSLPMQPRLVSLPKLIVLNPSLNPNPKP